MQLQQSRTRAVRFLNALGYDIAYIRGDFYIIKTWSEPSKDAYGSTFFHLVGRWTTEVIEQLHNDEVVQQFQLTVNGINDNLINSPRVQQIVARIENIPNTRIKFDSSVQWTYFDKITGQL